VLRIVSIGYFKDSVGFSVDLLAGHCEGFARGWCCGFAKHHGAVFVGLGCVHELVNLISGFGGEFEQRAVALRVDFFREDGHSCFVEMVGFVWFEMLSELNEDATGLMNGRASLAVLRLVYFAWCASVVVLRGALSGVLESVCFNWCDSIHVPQDMCLCR